YNLVFMQYNRDNAGKLNPLPKPSVDTGLGLERTASILQNVPSNYDIDLFQSIIKAITEKSGATYVPDLKNETASAVRVVADHLRAVTFLIADGVLPSNEGRGYVLRRILRRAVRYGKKLGFTGPFFAELVPSLIQSMASAYPELKEKEKFVREAIHAEEEKFFQTLERGLAILSEELKKVKKGQPLAGAVAFLLYDSFGFPFDLTAVVSREQGVEVDEAAFNAAMEKQRTQSRAAQDGEAGATEQFAHVFEQLATRFQPTKFLGYEGMEGSGKILAILQDGKEVEEAHGGHFDAIFDASPFYGESGGQAGDSGEILEGGRAVATVKIAKKPVASLTVVSGTVAPGAHLKVGKTYDQRVPRATRLRTQANHSATHLLHWALRKVLGNHVKQAGSLVTPELLRFDFTHFKALTEEEKTEVETIINEKIALSEPLRTKLMSKDEAIAAGAMALFGEKYDDEVRVVSMGDGFSTELCGGTHVDNTSQIGCLVLVSEGGVAAGVRRIVAYTSMTAVDYLRGKASALDEIRGLLKAGNPDEAVAKVERLQTREKELDRKITAMQAESAGNLAKELVENARD
ncbi:MAG: alanine--tRNA ligase, partial [Proteobacteria bacterium]